MENSYDDWVMTGNWCWEGDCDCGKCVEQNIKMDRAHTGNNSGNKSAARHVGRREK